MSVPSYKVKCVMLGDPSIDTWNLISEHIQCSFTKRYKRTIGCDIGIIDVQLPYEQVTLSIWDIASSDRYRFFRSSYFRGASCAILAFDLTRYDSLNPTLINLITELYTTLGAIPIILIGCNAAKVEQRQIPRDVIDQLCEQMAHTVYFETDFNDERIISVFEAAAEIILAGMGRSEEDRRIAYEWKKQRLETLMIALEEMNFCINDQDEVEILTRQGIFSINILNGAVYFESIICSKCNNHSCLYKKHARRKSLCIVSAGTGWSNQELQHNELLTLAKIFAIIENDLPAHVLNQMRQVEECIDFSDTTEEQHLPENDIQLEENHENENIYTTSDLFSCFSPSEAYTLLRNHRIQFYEGRLPYSVYILLKERYEKIIRPF
ncbi:MAG: GTP-binding protein [Candidatus Helarchaeota archaeon]|nr:GTP-binding protein [Candidatus Helarchaeota archaeon]